MELKHRNLIYFLICGVCMLCLFVISKGELEPVLKKCCSIGSVWGKNHTTCAGPPSPVAGIPNEDRLSCATAIYICCIRIHRYLSCEKGKQNARASQSCTVDAPGGDAHKDCCEACNLGLRVHNQGLPCKFKNFGFGSPFDESFSECCEQSTVNDHDNSCNKDNPCSQLCKMSGNEMECSCYAGYRLLEDKENCEDINECELGTSICNPATETCQNVIGGFSCINKDNFPGSCPPGFIKNPQTKMCDDIDECTADVCPSGKLCSNTIGSYICISQNDQTNCPPGFRKDSRTNRCIDIDECMERTDRCSRDIEYCVNVQGNYQCILKNDDRKDCPAGLKWDDHRGTCEDIDECAEELDDCFSLDEECRNTLGGYECDPKCAEGEIFNEAEQKCSGFDYCAEHKCKHDEVCLNVHDGYQCIKKAIIQCPPGYKPMPAIDNVAPSCIDVNECEENLDTCDATHESCINEIGSYGCEPRHTTFEPITSCTDGFQYDIEKEKCLDINECEQNPEVCDKNTENCINTNGSYICEKRELSKQCPPGYRVNIETGHCDDINECEENRNECLHESERCVNMIGGYRCDSASPTCSSGYYYNTTTKICEDVDECLERKHNCSIDFMCINTPGGFQCFPKPSCQHGYFFSVIKKQCIDVNECTENRHTCNLETQVCANLLGSYRCVPKSNTCPHGYRANADDFCGDINECEENKHDCNPITEDCVNTLGSHQCQKKPRRCGNGYDLNKFTKICEDINECQDPQSCEQDQICENLQGSYRCLCAQGYSLNTVTKECRDVNECQYNLHSCLPNQRCDNTIGSYTCTRVTGCGTGYTLNAQTSDCEDDDECILGTHNCGFGYVCRNIDGSFRCDRKECPRGHKLTSDGLCIPQSCNEGYERDLNGNCVDINECLNSNICRRNQRCINSIGSYRCQDLIICSVGFEMNEYGSLCVDVDECANELFECGPRQVCRNRPGSYTCECPVGHRLNAERQCEDIDECTHYQGHICSSVSTCENTQGSYICNCNDGFVKAEDNKNCVDINECKENPDICQQTCLNVWGSYQCSCRQGFTLAPDGKTCEDIDECTLWQNQGNRLCIGNCINEPGSYSCSCPEGYQLNHDKRTCKDIDECQEQNVCKGENEVCLNTRGSFKCNIITCPLNYVRDHEHRNRCKRTNLECRHGDKTCLDEPLSLSYNYITFVSNMRIPLSGQLDFFTMRGPRFSTTSVQFSMDLKHAVASKGHAVATKDYFNMRRTAFNEAMVSLIRPIVGPQDIELELLMKIYHNGLFGGKAIAKLFIFVTEHEF